MTEEIVEKITKLYQEEMKTPQKVMTRSSIPSKYELITPEWLTDILCRNCPGAKVVSYELGPSDDGTSNRRRIHITYNEAGKENQLPASVFCKGGMNLDTRIFLGLSGCADSETIFYNKLRPNLNIEAPFAYYSAFNPETFASIAVLKDLGGEAEFCDETTYIDRQKAESMVDLLAEFHGAFYGDPRLESAEIGLKTWPYWFQHLKETIDMEASCKRGFLAAGDVIPSRLYARAEDVWPATERAVARHLSLPMTILHGDPHIKNWYYVPARKRMGLGDWQALVLGHWARDYAYAVSSALQVEDRRSWEEDLLRRYIDGLETHGVAKISFDEAWEHYRQQLFGGLSYWTITLTPPAGMPDMQPVETTLEIIKRIAHAIDDLDALDSFKDE